jgi:hypothetical protein
MVAALSTVLILIVRYCLLFDVVANRLIRIWTLHTSLGNTYLWRVKLEGLLRNNVWYGSSRKLDMAVVYYGRGGCDALVLVGDVVTWQIRHWENYRPYIGYCGRWLLSARYLNANKHIWSLLRPVPLTCSVPVARCRTYRMTRA